MNNLTINTQKKNIVMTKGFAKKASVFGTPEYKMLQDARKDYPTYSVTTKKSTPRENYKGLTLDYMKTYIKAHPATVTIDGTEENVLSIFYKLAGLDSNGQKNPEGNKAAYGQIRKWFLDLYPELKLKNDNLEKYLKSEKKAA